MGKLVKPVNWVSEPVRQTCELSYGLQWDYNT